jgi:hypothetical protein
MHAGPHVFGVGQHWLFGTQASFLIARSDIIAQVLLSSSVSDLFVSQTLVTFKPEDVKALFLCLVLSRICIGIISKYSVSPLKVIVS